MDRLAPRWRALEVRGIALLRGLWVPMRACTCLTARRQAGRVMPSAPVLQSPPAARGKASSVRTYAKRARKEGKGEGGSGVAAASPTSACVGWARTSQCSAGAGFGKVALPEQQPSASTTVGMEEPAAYAAAPSQAVEQASGDGCNACAQQAAVERGAGVLECLRERECSRTRHALARTQVPTPGAGTATPPSPSAQPAALPAVSRGQVFAACAKVSGAIAAAGLLLRAAAPFVSPAVADGHEDAVQALLQCECTLQSGACCAQICAYRAGLSCGL